MFAESKPMLEKWYWLAIIRCMLEGLYNREQTFDDLIKIPVEKSKEKA